MVWRVVTVVTRRCQVLEDLYVSVPQLQSDTFPTTKDIISQELDHSERSKLSAHYSHTTT